MTPEEREILLQRLSEAETAYHRLQIGASARVIVDQNGERVRYRSQSELQQALASVNRMILAVTLGSQPVTEIRFRTSKGI